MSNVKFYFAGITDKPSKDGTKIFKFITIHIQKEGSMPCTFSGFATDEQLELCKNKAQFTECECLFLPNKDGMATLSEISFGASAQGGKTKTVSVDADK